ncbi:tripartite motif-containing protein 16-like, partial [Diretmus argenteus]
ILENLKTTGSQQASPSAALVYAGPADVACDFCTGTRRNKAAMSCLTCMASYCEIHLQPHYSVPVLQKHKLVSATARLQEETCSSHDKLMEVYCRTDQQCVCLLCTLDEHKGHDTVSVAAERAEKQSSAQTAVQACDTIFTELIRSIERRLSEILENLKTTGSQQASPSAALVYAGPADVACDFCTGTRRNKAAMSCLTCMASYCEIHLQPHYSVPVLQKHKLVSATARLQEETCSSHDKLMEVYCRTDQQCVCLLCTLDEHKGHDTVSVAAERAEKQSSAQTAVQACDTIFTELIRSIERRLSEILENLKTTGSQQASPSAALVYAGPADVACDFCTGTRRNKAAMSCLTCMASYCEIHLQPHYSVPVLQKHKLVSATARLQEETCSSHDKLMEVYCRTDQQCVCLLCTLDEHKGHDTVSVAAERAEKQKQLGVSQQTVQKRVQERERELKELSEAVEDLKSSAQTAVQACDTIFTELIRSIERRLSEVKQLIRAQEKTAVSQAEELLLQLEEEIARLRRRDTELEELSHTDHHIHFIQVLLPPEPKTREDFLQYCCPLTFDVNSVSTCLSLSENNRKVTFVPKGISYPDHPDRFTKYRQVLCREGLSGRCYWEFEWKGDNLEAAVSYKDIRRTGADSLFGNNNKSWSLWFYQDRYYFKHNEVETEVSGPCCSRVGVYLDHEAGTLSFYSVSDTMTLLHKVCTTFTQPLYPGIALYGSDGEFAELIKLW